jgi:aminoglycoside phosphotransferase (APT) family kinase protein
VPVRIGEPSDRFPESWIVTGWVHGSPADLTPIERGPHAAEILAGFLAALHQEAPRAAPIAADRGVPLAGLADGVEKRLRSMDADEKTARMRAVWDDAIAATEWDRPPVWLHADLHPANILVAKGTLAGVIDFGDMCAGDPATDLAAAWVLLPEGADSRFFDLYEADKDTVRRARGWAMLKSWALIEIGHAGDMGWTGGKPTWKPAGEYALDRLLAPYV